MDYQWLQVTAIETTTIGVLAFPRWKLEISVAETIKSKYNPCLEKDK